MQISFAVTAKLINAFVFATHIERSLFFLNPKFQASNHVLWMYSPVCLGPGRKPRRPFFSQRGSYCLITCNLSERFEIKCTVCISFSVKYIYNMIAIVVHWLLYLRAKKRRFMRTTMFWFPTWSVTNQAVLLQKMARGLKFRF